LQNLRFKIGKNFVFLPDEGSEKSRVRSFLKALAHEINYYSPMSGVADIIRRTHTPETTESFISDGSGVGLNKGDTYLKKVWDYSQTTIIEEKVGINHFRRLRRAFKRDNLAGVLLYIKKLSDRFEMPKDLTSQEMVKHQEVINYFIGLSSLVSHLKLPKR
jgi:hypothetical protein